MTPEDYLARFPAMRAHLDRVRFLAERWPVGHIESCDPAVLAGISTIFWPRASRLRLLATMARGGSLPVIEAARRLDELRPRERTRILGHMDWMRKAGAVRLTLPLYRLGPDHFLLLDGNHRLTAVVATGIAFHLVGAVLEGPVGREAADELRFFEPGLKRFLPSLPRPRPGGLSTLEA